MSNQWYVVPNLDNFIDNTRTLVFNSFGSKLNTIDDESDTSKEIDFLMNHIEEEDVDELNRVLSHAECSIIASSLIKKQINKKNKKIRYLINDTIFLEIISSFNDRMISNMLNGLVNKGLLETGFDSEVNDFVFWIPEEKKEKPETD